MNIGDVVVAFGKQWIIYDINSDGKHLYVTDFETQDKNEYIAAHSVTEVCEKPKNVSWLFLVRRKRNLEGLGAYL